MDFWFIVVHALPLRCFTLTVRPRTALPLPVPRALFFLLFRRLRFIGGLYLKWTHSLRESAEVWLLAAGVFPAS